MTKRELSHAFDPFFTTKQTGSGLGLYLSRKIVAEMDAKLDIVSRKGMDVPSHKREVLDPGVDPEFLEGDFEFKKIAQKDGPFKFAGQKTNLEVYQYEYSR